MSMEWVRKTYNVPAKRGGKILYQEGNMKNPLKGIITSADHRLRVRVQGIKGRLILHPTIGITYLTSKK